MKRHPKPSLHLYLKRVMRRSGASVLSLPRLHSLLERTSFPKRHRLVCVLTHLAALHCILGICAQRFAPRWIPHGVVYVFPRREHVSWC